MKYRYKLARSIKIGDVLHVETEQIISDKDHPEVAPHLVKIPQALFVSSIEAEDDGMTEHRVFIDRATGLVVRARPDSRLRLANLIEEKTDEHNIDKS
jgi:hypothetical protein